MTSWLAMAFAGDYIARGISYQLEQRDLVQAKAMYVAALHENASNIEAWHLLGVCAYSEGDFHQAQTYFERGIEVALDDAASATTHCNLAETLRKLHQPNLGLPHALVCHNKTRASEFSLRVLSWLYIDLGMQDNAADILQQLVAINQDDIDAWHSLGSVYAYESKLPQAIHAFSRVLEIDPHDTRARLRYDRRDLAGAMNAYNTALAINATDVPTLQGLAVLYQQLGRLPEAIAIYERILREQPSNVPVLNNLGAALKYVNRRVESVKLLEASIQLDPSNTQGYVNLASYYEEEGMTRDENEPNWSTRVALEAGIDDLLNDSLSIDDPVDFEVRPPFYLVYQGMNDVAIQTKLARLYMQSCPLLTFVAPHTMHGVGSLRHFDESPRRLRLGFMSKFFVHNHAHGLLLRGILAHLNRDVFEIVLLAVPDPQQSVDPLMAAAADQVKVLSMHLGHVQQDIAALELDVLVFADIMSEPINYFTAFSRLAHVQAAFWGNPTTSGIPNIDYFISADNMESSPDPAVESHYLEQVVLLSGLGIWYDEIEVPATLGNHSDYDLDPSWTVYMCPQSVYKLLPSFDAVLIEILRRDPAGHLVLLQARRLSWTQQFQARLAATMPREMHDRVHFVPRVAGNAPFLKLLSVADVVLHPFPFGGSKTSADALRLGIPLVAMKTPFLRSRMAYSFFVHVDLLDCITTSEKEYIDKAVRLGTDRLYHDEIAQRIKAKQSMLWESHQVVQEWERFLYNAVRSLAG
ncbi:unnamed protein product [Aphanomyces euteiches]